MNTTTPMDQELTQYFHDCIEQIYNMKDEFFYNDETPFAKETLIHLTALRRQSKWFLKRKETHRNQKEFKKNMRRAIRMLDLLIVNKSLYEVNIGPLTEIKEKLEGLYVMTELSK
jgi:hypothetical protein